MFLTNLTNIKKMSFILIIAIFFTALSKPTFAFFDDNEELLQILYQQWNAQDYKDVKPRLKNYFNKIDNRGDVAFWLATSMCRTNEITKGKNLLKAIKQVVTDPANIVIIDHEISVCGHSVSPRDLVRQGFIGSVGRGKQMEVGFEDKSLRNFQFPTATQLVTSNYLKPKEELKKRLVPLNNPALAIKTVEQSLETKFDDGTDLFLNPSVQKIGTHFIVACLQCNHHSDFSEIGKSLESYMDFFSQQYRLDKPTNFITIYVVEHNDVMSVAQKIHGVSPNFGLIGYSIPEDMSMVAQLPTWDSKLHGTLKHELFHLMLRNNFDFASPWIEEGMATLYEGSEIQKGTINGVRNWREDVLRKNFAKRPNLAKLIEMNWIEFNEMNTENKQTLDSHIGVIHAMARYFILYLQSKGKLSEVYNKMKAVEITDDYEIKVPQAESVLTNALAMKSVSDIDNDFVKWFNSLNKKTKKPAKR